MTNEPASPLFLFIHQRDIEREGGFALAGTLFVDVLKERLDSEEQRFRAILDKFVAAVCEMADNDEVLLRFGR